MRSLALLLALVPVTLLGSVDVFRWTDANGQTHYSDRPQAGAERVTIAVSPPAGGSGSDVDPAAGQEDTDTAPEFVRYQSLTITSPAQEQTLWNIEGQLDVAAAVQPELQPGHSLRFTLDGRQATAEPGSRRIRFAEVFRGEHSLQVEVLDAAGTVMAASLTTRFFVRQTALPNPIPPLPRPPARP